MEYNTTSTMNPTSLPTMDPGKICCANAPIPDRTIKDNMMEATEILSDIEAQVDRIKNWMWYSDDEPAPKMDIMDLNSNVVRNLEFERRILKKLMFIADRLGC